MIVNDWRGRTWDYDGDIRVKSAKGLEDMVRRSAQITGGRDGGAPSPAFSEPGAFTLELQVFADSDEDMADKLADLYAATWDEDPLAEHPFTFEIRGQEQLTVFAKVATRQPPTDFDSEDRYQAALVVLGFEFSDPRVYLPMVTVDELEPGSSFTVAGGWASTQRWQWIWHGPATNPRFTVHTDGYPDQVLRLVRTVNDGQNVNVVSTPSSLVTTVGGFDRYGDFDGGNTNIAARFPKLLAGQVLQFGGTGGDGTFSYWPARP